MEILPNGRVRIKNFETGETKEVTPGELPTYGGNALLDQYIKLKGVQESTPAPGGMTQYFSNPAPTTAPSTYIPTTTQTNKSVVTPQQAVGTKQNNLVTPEKPAYSTPEQAVRSGGNKILDTVANFLVPETKKYLENTIKDYQEATKDPKKAQKLIEKASKIPTNPIDMAKGIITGEGPAREIAKPAAEVLSYVAPVGKTYKAAAGLGAGAGALRGASSIEKPEDILPAITSGALGGTVGGVAGKVVGDVLSGVMNLFGKGSQQSLTKATPSAIQKGIEEHGVNINTLAKEYIPAGSKNYDEILGAVEERNRGGILGARLKDAEDKIQAAISKDGKKVIDGVTADDFLEPLFEARTKLVGTVGNEAKITQLDGLIKETEKLMRSKITPEKLLNLKRASDEIFGKAVVDDTTGTIITQVQKLIANKARAVLKAKFPDIADALNTQSDIYTLLPVIGKARATTIIDPAGLSKLDVGKPGTYQSVIMGNPAVSSTLSKFDSSTKLPAITQTGGRALGSSVATMPITPSQPQEMNNKNSQGNLQSEQQHTGSILDSTVQSQTTGQEYQKVTTPDGKTIELNPENVLNAANKARLLGDIKGAENLEAIHAGLLKNDKAKKDSISTPKPLSGPNTVLKVKAESAVNSLDRMAQELSTNPNLITSSKLNPLDQGGRLLGQDITSAIDILGYFRTGAAITPDQRSDYLYMFPSPLDDPTTQQVKIQRLKAELQGYAEGISKSGGTDYTILPQITQ